MAYRCITSSLLRAVLGLTFLPMARLFCSVHSSTTPAAPSLRRPILSGSLIGCEPVQIYHHHPAPVGVAKSSEVVSTPTSLAHTLL
jgi:hypothetical protein